MACLPDEYFDRHKGEACIVIGDGPSVGDYDLTDPFFAQNVTFGCNRIGRAFTPTYYLISDECIYDECVAFMRPPSVLLRGCHVRHKPEPAITAEYSKHDLMGAPTKGRLYHAHKSGGLMLHIAYQMGFDRFFVLGIDGYNIAGKEHFYDAATSHPRYNREDMQEQLFGLFAAGLAAEGKRIWNLSTRSVFTSFPFCDLATAKAICDV